ncbi:MAG: phosphotransferase enzyme family protein, partial [Candidatus Moranbacteria bacterium]|nr:phosphotransferase enzyme family protein [Candidatus Moranbacteria bacterium]
MVKNQVEDILAKLFTSWMGEQPFEIRQLPASGSYRDYFRISGGAKTVIGVFYDQVAENKTFIAFSKHFRAHGLNVPEVYFVSDDFKYYLLEDLGDTTLFEKIQELRFNKEFQEVLSMLYQKALDELVHFQITAGKTLDYSLCHPTACFDEQAYQWDLNYFKYNFLKLANISFDEKLLEDDFKVLVNNLLKADHSWFVYRDFQSRNIMLRGNDLFFIDYQGGRKGALQYDVASLLFQARAEIPFEIREKLLNHYIDQVKKIAPEAATHFKNSYYHFVLIRVLQTLGAYGFRVLHEKKRHFIESIPPALENVKWLIENNKIDDELPELKKCLLKMLESDELKMTISPKLTLHINSFSYKRGIPVDLSGNGGGFVFDCRALPNPGRLTGYLHLTGQDT